MLCLRLLCNRILSFTSRFVKSLFLLYSSTCKFRVKDDSTSCPNQSCTSHQLGSFSVNMEFNVLVSFCDHTGSVDGVVLAGSVAEDILQCSVSMCVVFVCVH